MFQKCGENATWEINSAGILTITGTGEMYLFDWSGFKPGTPWADFAVRSVIISHGITNIGDHAFDSCTFLRHVQIPKSVTEICDDAFADCEKLTEIAIPEGVTCIGSSAFTGCVNLQSVALPSTIEYIGAGAFWNCHQLKDVIIPFSTYIHPDAFPGRVNIINGTAMIPEAGLIKSSDKTSFSKKLESAAEKAAADHIRRTQPQRPTPAQNHIH